MSPEEYMGEVREEFRLKYTAEEMARLLASIRIQVENDIYFADTDETAEHLCSILGLNPEDFEQ